MLQGCKGGVAAQLKVIKSLPAFLPGKALYLSAI